MCILWIILCAGVLSILYCLILVCSAGGLSSKSCSGLLLNVYKKYVKTGEIETHRDLWRDIGNRKI